LNRIISFIFIINIIYSCSVDNNIETLNGYWEIESVKKEGQLIKKYPFSNTIDFFHIEGLKGYRKKVTPKSNGRFMVTLHQADLTISKEKGEFVLKYLNKSKSYFEKILKIDSQQLIILDKEGYIYKYNRYTPLEINIDGE
jgi:transcriptional regulator with PAS, ATPase and Fis domain